MGYITSLGFPVYEEPTGSPLWNQICRLLPNKIFTYLIGLGLMLCGAFLLYRANYALMLIREKTLLPFLLYVLFLSSNANFFPLKSTTVGVFCLILALYQLFTSYHDPEATVKSFKTALIIAIGSLLWIHILWFLPLFWDGMYRFRTLTLKTFVASLLGVATVYWGVLGWCVWQEDYTAFTVPFASLLDIHFLTKDAAPLLDWVNLIYIVILLMAAAINILTHEHEDNLRTRLFLFFLIKFAFWSLLFFFFYRESAEEFMHMACIPAAILTGHFFSVRRNRYTVAVFLFTVIFFPTLLMIRLWSFL
ncbi:hypothetical protein D0T51_06970 [Parabacteroides sp. 52]|uniref:hypothetical protein n=1 Tax=unclassified Parabacteroides TaxID=2649774 RepID=UPI0013D84011|nr:MULTISPECIES: hypothetical protein [unclassified Parabacteroides]NDV55469.1 hypothetical protein [Parabacteroides sp. 52]